VFVPLDPSIDVALAIFVAGELAAAGSTWAAARLRGVRRPTGRDLHIALRRAWPIALSSLMVYAYLANLDTVLLAALRSAEDAGLYSAPYRVFLALNVVGTFAAYSLLPGVTRSVVGGDPPAARAAIEEHLGVLGAYGLGVLGAVELVAADLLGMLFGSPFESMRSTFIVLVIAVPWYSVLFPVGYTLIGFERTKAYLGGAAAAGVLNVLMGLALIPVAGTIGAAVATTAALVVAGVVWLVLARLLDPRTIRLGSVLALASAGGVVAAASEDAAPFAGGATLLAAVALLGFSRRASQARR
jgi:O-antigen/teichoic acid export membrane protein